MRQVNVTGKLSRPIGLVKFLNDGDGVVQVVTFAYLIYW